MTFTLLPGLFAVGRLSPKDNLPRRAPGGPFVSITRTDEELSIVCLEPDMPRDAQADRGWRCLKLEGPLPLTATGIAAEFTAVLAAAGVSVFVMSTYDTDYVLVKSDRLDAACDALEAAGHACKR